MEQQLMGVSMLVEDASARLVGSPVAADRLRLAERMLRHCRDDSRTSIRDLLSVALEPDGLASAFPELLSPLGQSGGAKFRLEVTGVNRRLPGRAEHQFLRIAQEAVANAAQHSGASEIVVTLNFGPESLRLEVRDDGCGLSREKIIPNDGTHLGVAGMRERARRLGSSLSILTPPEGGTQIIVTVEYSTLR
jgi:signal transduction histidine kinase